MKCWCLLLWYWICEYLLAYCHPLPPFVLCCLFYCTAILFIPFCAGRIGEYNFPALVGTLMLYHIQCDCDQQYTCHG